jgi:hypothetical protein
MKSAGEAVYKTMPPIPGPRMHYNFRSLSFWVP